MPLRSVKMYGFIFGFQRRVWCPKWTPASRSAFIETTDMTRPPCFGFFLRPRHPPEVARPVRRQDGTGTRAGVGERVWCVERSESSTGAAGRQTAEAPGLAALAQEADPSRCAADPSADARRKRV